MSLIEKVQALQQMATQQAAPKYICKDAEFEYECGALNAMPDMLAVLGQFRGGDAERLDYAVSYLESTNCPGQCIDAMRRMQAACASMETDQQ